MTKNNQYKNLIESSKVFVLGFQMEVGTRFITRDADLKQKGKGVTQTLKLDPIIQFKP